jgi:NADPH:quinone reductase-like Zn-dependent oxidoreductase
MINAGGLTKRRGGRTVVSDVTFRCEPDTVARGAHATRVRQLATPSWLSTRRRVGRLSLVVRQRLGTFIARPNSTDLDALRALVEAGSVTPAVDRVITLDQTPAAIRDLSSGRVRGKVIIAT